MRYWLIVLVAIAAFTITTFSQQAAPTPTQAQLRYLTIWDGQAIEEGVATDIALNFAFLQNGSFVGEIQVKATKQTARFSSASVKPDGSIVFVLSVPNGPVRTHTGTLDASGQKMTGTYVHVLGAQSVTGTFTATRRPLSATAPPSVPKMTEAEIAQANAAADKAANELSQALKSTSDVSGLQIFSDKYISADLAVNDCVKRFPRFARCYEIRGRLWAARERDFDLTVQNLRDPNPPDYFKLAVDDLTKAIQIEPTSKYLYLVRGKFYLEARAGKPDFALADAEAALKIDPNYAPAKTLLADAQKKIAPK